MHPTHAKYMSQMLYVVVKAAGDTDNILSVLCHFCATGNIFEKHKSFTYSGMETRCYEMTAK
jgi:hypothetical protein